MGKTLPPFSSLQPISDRLFENAKLHIQAGVMVARPWPFETIVMAVLLEHEKRIAEVMERIEHQSP